MNIRGERNLSILLSGMAPELSADNYVFCLTESDSAVNEGEFFTQIREKEGITFITDQLTADRLYMRYDSLYRKITLNVHSDLKAVGLTAAVSTELAQHGISANIIAGFYHDHIFVPAERAEEALLVLCSLSRSVRN